MALGDVTVAGESRSYTLNFGMNAMCRLEALTGRPYHDVMQEIAKGMPSMGTLRSFVQAALVDPQPATADDAGVAGDEIGTPALLAAFAESGGQIADAAVAQVLVDQMKQSEAAV
jgi:hypothetical protein